MHRVYISGSVQEANVGVSVNGTPYNEEYWMQELARRTASILKQQNGKFEVFLNSPDWSLEQIVDDSNQLAVEIHVALHSDACSDGSVTGTTCYYRIGSTAGQPLAQSVYDAVAPLLPGDPDRGVHPDTDLYPDSGLYELRWTVAPACLIEVGFHTSVEEATAVVNKILSDELPWAVARGIAAYLNESIAAQSSAAPVVAETPSVEPWQLEGEQYLRDMGYTTQAHSPLETVEFGELGMILKHRDAKIQEMVDGLYKQG